MLILAAIVGTTSPVALATAEKSAKFYEDALARYERNDLTGAAVQLKNALKQNNKNLAAHMLYGRLLQQVGALKAAEGAFEQALKEGVSKVEVAPLLGQVYLQLGNTRQLLDTITPAGLPPIVQAEVLTLRGSAMAMTGNYNGAMQAFVEARTLDPKSALPYIAEGALLLRTGERERAKAIALKGAELAPTNSNAWYQYGTILYTLGDLTAALTAFDKAISANNKHVDSRVSRASVLMGLRRIPEATAELKTLKDAKVIEPRASFLRATLAAERGETQAARADYTEAANLIDAMSPTVRADSEPLLMAGALSHHELGNREKTREYLEVLLSRNSRNTAAQALLAGTLLEANELNRAVPMIEALLRLNPNDARALHMMGSVHLERRQYVQASELLERASKLAPNGPALRDLSFSQLGLGQEKVGLANLERAYSQNPKDQRAGIELAVYYARTGDAVRAIKVAQALVNLDPNNLTMLNFLGNVKGRLGDKKGLKETYERALAKDPKFRPVVMNMSWFDMEEGRLDLARTRLRTFLKDNPKDPDVLFQLGLLEQSARKPADALAYWAEADRIQQKDPRAGLAIVDQYIREQQVDKALAAAKVLAGRYGEAPEVLMSLARSHMLSGEIGPAKHALQEASVKAGFDPETLLAVGRMQMQIGNFEGATHAANKALQSSPNDALALGLLVEVAGRRGNPAEVDKAMATLQSKHPNLALTLVAAGHIAFSRNQVPKAIGLYKTVYDREPSTPLALNLAQAYAANKEPDKGLALLAAWSAKRPGDNMALRALADMQLFAGKADAARQSFGALAEANPNDAMLIAAYASVLVKLNDPTAVATAEKAFKLAPNNASIADTYGWALVQHGDADAAVRVLREARLREPGNGNIRWHLAAALAKAGKKAEARGELQAALAAIPPPSPSPDLDRLKADLRY